MSWFADLAGKAESLLNNLDEQTGVALRNHNVARKRHDNNGIEYGGNLGPEGAWVTKKRPMQRSNKKAMPIPDTKSLYAPSRKSSPTSHHQPRSQIKDNQDSSRNGSVKSKKSPSRRPSPHQHQNQQPHQQYSLNHCPKTLVGDVKDNDVYSDHFGLKQRSEYNTVLFLDLNYSSAI